jgi:hypothetical protein
VSGRTSEANAGPPGTPALRALQPVRLAVLCAGMALATFLVLPKEPPTAAAQTVEVETIPPLSGVRVAVAGQTFHTDARGKVVLPLGTLSTGQTLRGKVKIHDKRLSRTARARFGRWYGESTAALSFEYLVRPVFRNLAGEPVDPELVSSVSLKARNGVRTTIRGGDAVWLPGTRVVPYLTQTRATTALLSKNIDYQIEKVLVDGANVVNRAQQRFMPRRTRVVPVRLLFFETKVASRDAFFGFPIGSAVVVRYPSGRSERHRLGAGATTVLRSLPRGEYDVKIEGGGISFTRPLSVSRHQEVELKVLSWVDIGLAVLALVAFTLGPIVARRRHARGRTRRETTAVDGVSGS